MCSIELNRDLLQAEATKYHKEKKKELKVKEGKAKTGKRLDKNSWI